jgi:hypothetical protein
MSEPTPRQVLYALVAGGFILVVAVLVVGAAVAGLVPIWWTWLSGGLTGLLAVCTAIQWRMTGRVLGLSIGMFVFWTVGTLLVT